MRTWRLLALALVVLGLGAFIYFYERNVPTTDQRAERKDKLFPTFEQTDARRVVIDGAHGRVELVKENDDWRLVAPLVDEANQGAVTGLLSTLAGAQSERVLDASELDLSQYGLAEPKLAVEVEGEGGTNLATLKLGDELPLGGQRAATIGGDKVYFVSKWIASDLDRDLAAWRSTSLARVLAADVASLMLRAPEARVALAHGAGVWRMTEPVADLADRDRVEGLLSDLNGAQIKEFVDQPGDLGELGLAPPRAQLTVVRKDADPLELWFGAERDQEGGRQVAAKRGDRVFWVEASAVERLTADPTVWRADTLVALDTWAARGLEIEANGETAALERSDGVWKAASTEVDQAAVAERLRTLADLAVVAFDRPAPSGEALGRVKVTFDEEERKPIEVRFHPGTAEGEAIAVVEGRAGALGVDRARVAELLADPAALAKPEPTPTPEPTPSE